MTTQNPRSENVSVYSVVLSQDIYGTTTAGTDIGLTILSAYDDLQATKCTKQPHSRKKIKFGT